MKNTFLPTLSQQTQIPKEARLHISYLLSGNINIQAGVPATNKIFTIRRYWKCCKHTHLLHFVITQHVHIRFKIYYYMEFPCIALKRKCHLHMAIFTTYKQNVTSTAMHNIVTTTEQTALLYKRGIPAVMNQLHLNYKYTYQSPIVYLIRRPQLSR